MRANVAFALTAALALALTAGCQKALTEADVVRKWDGKMVVSKEQADKAAKERGLNAEQTKAMMDMMASATLPLEMKEDKSFTMSLSGIPMEGTWTLSGQTVTLTYTKAMGTDVQQIIKDNPQAAEMIKPIPMTVAADGKSMSSKGQAGGDMSFTKQAAAK
jgi:nitrate reductase beta subunit